MTTEGERARHSAVQRRPKSEDRAAPTGSHPAGTGGPARGERSRWRRLGDVHALRIVAVYFVFGIAWILFSDRAVEAAFADAAARARIQTVKGTIFVAATAALLYVLIRRSEAGLRAVGAEVRATVDSIADAVLVVDEGGRIVEANRAAQSLLGVADKADLLVPLLDWGRRFALRTADGTPVPAEEYATLRALGGERVQAYQAILRRADGRDLYVGVSAAPVAGADGRGRLAVAVLRDESPARRLEEMRDEFLSTAAHELKTPLAVVKAYAQLLARRPGADANPLAVIQRQVDRMNRLVERLLEASRVELERFEVRREPFDLAALAADVVDRMRPAARGHALRATAPGPVTVVGDRARIERVVAGLLENAIRFSPDGGPVEARVETRDADAVLTVEDHGVGIPAERQGRVFERWYRAHAGTEAEEYGGLGIGLGLAREIVARQGGRIWFESEPGRGSAFHFSLPLAAGARA